LGKSGGFDEKRVSDIEPFNPQIVRMFSQPGYAQGLARASTKYL